VQTAVSGGLWRRIGWIAAIVVVLLIAWWLVVHIPRTITIFVAAAFIAFGVGPVAQRLQTRMPKPVAISVVFVGLLLIVAIGLVIVVPLTIDQMQLLARNLPSYAGATQDWLMGMQTSVQQHFPQVNLPASGLNVGKIGGAQLTGFLSGALTGLGTVAINTATGLFMAFSAIVLSFFFLLNDTQIAQGFASMFPASKRETAQKLSAEVTALFGSYISGQVIVSAITGAVIAVATAIIGFKFSLIIGIISGVAYAIPIIGMLIAQIIAVPLCAPQGLWMVIWVQIIMFVMARISDNVLVPKIMGESVGVSPIGAMLAVFAGGELFGIPGLILGIPVAALVKILWRYFVAPWIQSQFREG
jgi:predicted PurR-regulated permease PerM